MLPNKASEIVDALGLIPHPEGGFFLETYRSGTQPMTTRGKTDTEAPFGLVTSNSVVRHALTSIYWVPTLASPIMPLVCNKSAHVHYYHGGKPFEYTTYNPVTKELTKEILGPDLVAGHKLQVVVEGGLFKCGRLLVQESYPQEYCLMGEAVGPGFDVDDFTFVESDKLEGVSEDIMKVIGPYVKKEGQVGTEHFQSFYNDDELRILRTQQRS